MFASTTRARAGLALCVLIGGTLVLTLSRAWRLPNDFAEAHWLLDYRFGFVKRGLAGQVLSSVMGWFGGRPTAAIISAISIVLLGVLALVLLWTAWQVIRAATRQEAAALASLAFVSSPFIVMSAHLAGYLDGILILLTVAALALTLRGRLWAGAATMAAAILVHESAIVVGFPVLVLAWWARSLTASEAGQLRPNLKHAVPLLLPVIAFAALALSARYLLTDFQDLYSQHLMAYPFVAGDMHVFVPEWLTPGFAQHVAEQKHRFAERITSAPMLGLVLPTVLAVLAWTVDACRVRPRSVTMALLFGSIFSPQLMHVAAWDTMRIWTYSIVVAWLGVWTLARTSGAEGEVSPGVRGLALVALVVNVAATTFLLDRETDHYSLTTRLVMFAPVLIGAVVLFLRRD